MMNNIKKILNVFKNKNVIIGVATLIITILAIIGLNIPTYTGYIIISLIGILTTAGILNTKETEDTKKAEEILKQTEKLVEDIKDIKETGKINTKNTEGKEKND